MPYLHPRQKSTPGCFACSPNCLCRNAKTPLKRSLGELTSTVEFSDTEKKLVASTIATIVEASGKPGIRKVNQLSDQVFFARYPGRNGRLIDPKTEPNLAQEWKNIKGRLVLPIIEAIAANKRGRDATFEKDYVRAVRFFDRARRVSVSPAQNRAAATLNLGIANLQLKRFAAAIGYFEIVRTFPDISDDLRAKAEGFFSKAKQQYRQAVP